MLFQTNVDRIATENGLIICLAIPREVYSILNCSEEKELKQILQTSKKKKKTLMKL